MNLSELLSKGLVEKFQSDSDQIKNEIEIAKNDLSSAKNMLGIKEWGWAHNAAYNAMLQAGSPAKAFRCTLGIASSRPAVIRGCGAKKPSFSKLDKAR